MKHVVVWDPKNDYWEGAIVDEEQVASLQSRGVATLPAAPEIFGQVGFAGFAKRSWGSGWPLDSNAPQQVCPLSIYYPGEPYRVLTWRARLIGTSGQGVPLRMCPGEGRGNCVRPVLQDFHGRKSAVDVARLGKPDAHGGWTVGGEVNFCVSQLGTYALALYGCAPGMRVAWVAATLTQYSAATSLSAASLMQERR